MGISTRCYLIYGWETEWNKELNEFLHEHEEKLYDKYGYGNPIPPEESFDYVIDGMGGSYMVFGIILARSTDFRWDAPEFEYKASSLTPWPMEVIDYIDKARKILPENLADWIFKEHPLKHHLFFHYT